MVVPLQVKLKLEMGIRSDKLDQVVRLECLTDPHGTATPVTEEDLNILQLMHASAYHFGFDALSLIIN